MGKAASRNRMSRIEASAPRINFYRKREGRAFSFVEAALRTDRGMWRVMARSMPKRGVRQAHGDSAV
jgi:hypothetical protein